MKKNLEEKVMGVSKYWLMSLNVAKIYELALDPTYSGIKASCSKAEFHTAKNVYALNTSHVGCRLGERSIDVSVLTLNFKVVSLTIQLI